MFGYMQPFKPDLKIKHYTTFKSYYCSLCHEIKKNYGNIPRIALNLDTTFMSIILDGLSITNYDIQKKICILHPTEKKLIMKSNPSITYASHITMILTHNKIIDDINDENNLFLKAILPIFNKYMKKLPHNLNPLIKIIKNGLEDLKKLEASRKNFSIDEFAHPFANIVKNIFGFYLEINNSDKNHLIYIENIGYNLGKWIYIIDAFDDIEKDFKNKSFNPILNLDNLQFDYRSDILEFKNRIRNKFSSLLTHINYVCLNNLNKIKISKNYSLIENILQLGMPFKLDKVLNNPQCSNRKEVLLNE